jgi:hypothetical protein
LLYVAAHGFNGGFQIALFKLIVAGRLYKPFVGQLPSHIVLIKRRKQLVQFRKPLIQPAALAPKLFRAVRAHGV